jgi:hypothetical protein
MAGCGAPAVRLRSGLRPSRSGCNIRLAGPNRAAGLRCSLVRREYVAPFPDGSGARTDPRTRRTTWAGRRETLHSRPRFPCGLPASLRCSLDRQGVRVRPHFLALRARAVNARPETLPSAAPGRRMLGVNHLGPATCLAPGARGTESYRLPARLANYRSRRLPSSPTGPLSEPQPRGASHGQE